MPEPRRVQLSRAAGWRNPAGAVVVARPSVFGNPFVVGDTVAIPVDGGSGWLEATITPEVAVALHRSWLADDAQTDLVGRIVSELAGHDLACWCPLGEPFCHANTLLEMANRLDAPGV